MTFVQAVRAVPGKYADFGGSASRSEFWWWTLFAALVGTGINAISAPLADGSAALGAVWFLGVLLPSFAVTVRRLRDAQYEWQHIFWILLPFAGIVVIAVLCTRPPTPRPNTSPTTPVHTHVDRNHH